MTFLEEYKPDADLGDAHLIQAAPAPHGSLPTTTVMPMMTTVMDTAACTSPWIMLAPLVICRAFGCRWIGGWPHSWGKNRFEHFLAPVMEAQLRPLKVLGLLR